jgi:regulator of protease activity HflC (stomatin/prohibitin superfamily)
LKANIEATFFRPTIMTVAQNAAGQMSLSEAISFKRDELQNAIQKTLVHRTEQDRMPVHED